MLPIALPEHPGRQESQQGRHVLLQQLDALLLDNLLAPLLLLLEQALHLHQLLNLVRSTLASLFEQFLDRPPVLHQLEPALLVAQLVEPVTLCPQLQLVLLEAAIFVFLLLPAALDLHQLALDAEPGLDAFAQLLFQVTLQPLLLPLVQLGRVQILEQVLPLAGLVLKRIIISVNDKRSRPGSINIV